MVIIIIILNYKYYPIEIQRSWNVKAKVTQGIIWATVTISKSLRQYLSHIPGRHEIKELQKTAHTGHCKHTAGNADVEIRNVFNVRSILTGSTNCKYRTAATLYIVETW